MVYDMFFSGNVFLILIFEIKKFLKIFGFGYYVIYMCKNDCIFYRKEYEDMSSCLRCGVLRSEVDKYFDEIKNGILEKIFRYFFIKERFKRMFRSEMMFKNL